MGFKIQIVRPNLIPEALSPNVTGYRGKEKLDYSKMPITIFKRQYFLLISRENVLVNFKLNIGVISYAKSIPFYET